MSDEDLVEEEQWRITDKGRDFLKAQRDAAQSKAQLIRLTRFEAFTEVLELLDDTTIPSTDLRRHVEYLRGRKPNGD